VITLEKHLPINRDASISNVTDIPITDIRKSMSADTDADTDIPCLLCNTIVRITILVLLRQITLKLKLNNSFLLDELHEEFVNAFPRSCHSLFG